LYSIVCKLVIQICAKTGGLPWTTRDLPLAQQPTMIVGVDVVHRKQKTSLIAVTCTTDPKLSRYWSSLSYCFPEETLSCLENAFKKGLTAFEERNKVRPSRVIIYRSGTSEYSGQKSKMEFETLNTALLSRDVGRTGAPAQLIYIVANKRCNTKFFQEVSETRRLENPVSGTILRAFGPIKENEFFLVSHQVHPGRGTAVPTHYIVSPSSWEAVPKTERANLMLQLQDLTHRLTFLYYNWAGSIRVPAPLQYAEKLAKMFGMLSESREDITPAQTLANSRSLYWI
jgi:aubergine-like protein